MRSCQQSITMALMGPSVGLNTPKVMQAVGSFWAFSEVATSYDWRMNSNLGKARPAGQSLNMSRLTMPPSSGSMISA